MNKEYWIITAIIQIAALAIFPPLIFVSAITMLVIIPIAQKATGKRKEKEK